MHTISQIIHQQFGHNISRWQQQAYARVIINYLPDFPIVASHSLEVCMIWGRFLWYDHMARFILTDPSKPSSFLSVSFLSCSHHRIFLNLCFWTKTVYFLVWMGEELAIVQLTKLSSIPVHFCTSCTAALSGSYKLNEHCTVSYIQLYSALHCMLHWCTLH